ncbi:MAG: SDR family NAD(P)-dependent oxidoreductase [Verrucomicrobia bacterium]|nr:SDR family NAD(P)-dependent oxidoreductase [Verrucomicrobiota bacterium]
MKNISAVITGAGSGVGRSVAFALASRGWNLALIGRRKELLDETSARAKEMGASQCLVCACDIGNQKAVAKMGERVLKEFEFVHVVVNAAGTNVPRRALEVLSRDDYRRMMDTNLNGAYYMIQAFLPVMRRAKDGTIVNIGSDAGLQASPKSGPAYVMSKFGLRGLTQSVNAEERAHGIRACSILPGDIDTPLLNNRPNPPSKKARLKMLRPEDIARCALLAIDLPPHAIVEELLIRPR